MPSPAPAPKLLVVDDDAGLVRLMARALQREGYAVTTAGSGAELEKRLREGPFTLLLVDLRLQDTTGPALLEKLEASGAQIPFVVITGQGDERVAVDMMKKGALDYLVKDAEFLNSMAARVRRAVESVQQRQRLAEAETALKREHAFISAILNTAGAIVIVLDSRDRIVRFNRAAERVTGFSAGEVSGAPFVETLVAEEDRAAARRFLEQMRAGGQEVQRQDRLKSKEGGTRLIAWSDTRTAGDDGRPGFIIKTGIDITEVRRLEEQILEISGREQRRIGQDLHDGLGQHLTGIELMTQCLEQALAARRLPEAAQAAKISQYVREAISQSKALARGLSPVALDRDGLRSALQELAGSTAELCRVRCEFECAAPIRLENNQAATHLYRIAQEAVNNAVKHGRASRISIRLEAGPKGQAALTVADNGQGFEPGRASPGMGLGIMRHRASVISGALSIAPAKGGGTEVRCVFPCPP